MMFPSWSGLASCQGHVDHPPQSLVWISFLGSLLLVTQLTAIHKDIIKNRQELARLKLNVQALIFKFH